MATRVQAINKSPARKGLEEVFRAVAQVLIMTVDPGFAHQPFIVTTLPKIRRVRRMIELAGARCEVGVDGGIDAETAPLVVTAGADVLVAGTAIFKEGKTVARAMERLRKSVQQVHQQCQVA